MIACPAAFTLLWLLASFGQSSYAFVANTAPIRTTTLTTSGIRQEPSWQARTNLASSDRSIASEDTTPTNSCSAATTSRDNSTTASTASTAIRIRHATFAELSTDVVDIVMKSFYVGPKAPKLLGGALYRLAELSRMQQNFPYAADQVRRHRMLVAEATTLTTSDIDDGDAVQEESRIVGFCDVDARIPNQSTGYKHNPRPYLSDLCIHPDYRRQGVAKALMEACEEFGLHDCQCDAIYCRVERDNQAAVLLYEGLGYRHVPEYDHDEGKVVVLRKMLVVPEREDTVRKQEEK